MLNKKFKLSLVSLLVFMLIVLTACGNTSTEIDESVPLAQEQGNKVVNVGVTYAPSNINPLNPTGLVSTYVANLLFLPLVDVDSELNFQPMLADSITTEDNKTFTINLNKTAVWSDGTPVTADDVIYTLQLMTNEKVASTLAYVFAIIEGVGENGYVTDGQTSVSGVAKVDDHTLTITTKQPTTLTIFQDTVGRYLLTLPKSELENIEVSEINKSEFMQYPTVTSGPFMLSEFNRDQYVAMIPNEKYFKGAPKIDQLNFKVLDSTAIAAQLKTGEIDMNIPSAGVIPVSDYELVKGLSHVTTTYGEPLATQYMYINEDVFADAKVRQAISYAINRELIVNNLLKGAGEVIDGFFSSISPYKNEEIKPVAYNPELAKQLLAETDFDTSKTYTVSVISGDATLEQAASIMAENLKAVGINVELQMLDFGSINEKIMNKDYEIAIFTISIVPINPLADITFYVGPNNLNNYDSVRVNEILSSLAQETNEVVIKALYDELQVILQEDVPMPSIYATTALGAVNNRVQGASASDFGMFINVHEWNVQ